MNQMNSFPSMIEGLFFLKAVTFIFIEVALIYLIISSSNFYKFARFNLPNYVSTQKIHNGSISRLGGGLIVFLLLLFVLTGDIHNSNYFLLKILSCFVPSFILSMKEDIFFNTRPIHRLITLLTSSFLILFIISDPLPDLSKIKVLTVLANLPNLKIIFFAVALASISNGMNLIDGVNGLCSIVAISILASLLSLSLLKHDFILSYDLTLVICLILPFFIFNYPKGKIFLGDTGAYFFGFFISIYTIFLFGRHQEINPWLAILILIYPITETIFTFSRRLFARKKFYTPDLGHLHSVLFIYFSKIKNFSSRKANYLVLPSLCFFWLFPFSIVILNENNTFIILMECLIFILIYIIFYFTTLKKIHPYLNYLKRKI